ncbi:RNA polymerase sigma factor [Actinospongicola halichondriae]|uniref:RNA polymerase sigma factor n=1 Tax=Actinospongicola halichondriae TaxID=3236844 RepID=UPI003D48829F
MNSSVPDARWPTDAALVAAVRRGDGEAFGVLVRGLHGPLVRMATIYVPAALAEEVVQDTWIAVIRSIDGFEGRSSLKSWIYRIMLNKVRTLAVREARVVPFSSTGPADDPRPAVDPHRLEHPDLGPSYWPAAPNRWDDIPDDRLLSDETLAVIDDAMAKLPPAQREVVSLRDVEGWNSEEVCEALGISSVNQRVLLHRARTQIRRALEEYFDA